MQFKDFVASSDDKYSVVNAITGIGFDNFRIAGTNNDHLADLKGIVNILQLTANHSRDDIMKINCAIFGRWLIWFNYSETTSSGINS
ncbi:uncharacterized protein ASCRUDRAFT_148885 [Ascoidea rubescens DSM 1968]|uniref:Uncharacterized protein n=1 Tax=Ascoidea rubescens DSM 1968 TaxID=1344418 RepID=A0A1D2VGN4_9ASCO|nr:hypothetical protein ASCRUDRAFT_148885 [Ascoidea rubescens DSM 1968]ODV60637.1 hypothetical protein ASCRUDRAFT_148885 [Ascoidea rubescens DSM 1968]